MTPIEKFNQDITAAMRAKDAERLSVLRMAKTALKKIEQYQDFQFINSLKSLEVARPRPAKPAASADTQDVSALREHSAAKLEKLDLVGVADLRGELKAKKEDSARARKAEAEKLVATLRKDGQARRRVEHEG